MTTLQEQARALGDPTRHSIFRYINAAESPVGVAQLTAHLGLNHNAIRQHLAKLVDAALVVEAKAPPTGPGRPRLIYTVDPGAESRWGATGPYERLSMLLSEIIRSGDTPVEVGRRAGRVGRVSTDDPAAAVEEISEAMAREGFEPEIHQRESGTDIVLRRCPFESTALADPDTICQLHLGLAEGLAEGAGSVEVEDLLAKDPRTANCRLVLHIEEPEAADTH